MDKRKYQSKTLIAEFSHHRETDEWYDKDSRFSEVAYRLKNGSIIIQYEGECFSQYGIAISFNRFIGRKGVVSINNDDYRIWMIVRKNDKYGDFIDWEKQYEDQLNKEYENMLKCVGTEELPF